MKSTSSANLFVGKQVDAGVIFWIFFSFFLTYLTYFYVLLMKKTSRKVFSCEKCFSDLKVKMCLVLWQKGWHKTSTHLFFPKIFFKISNAENVAEKGFLFADSRIFWIFCSLHHIFAKLTIEVEITTNISMRSQRNSLFIYFLSNFL